MGYITFYQFVSENVINIVINNLLNCMTITVLIFCVHPLTLLEEYLCKWRVLDQSVPINLGSSLTWQYQDTSRKPCRTLALSLHIVNAWNVLSMVDVLITLHLTPLCYCHLLNSCQETFYTFASILTCSPSTCLKRLPQHLHHQGAWLAKILSNRSIRWTLMSK